MKQEHKISVIIHTYFRYEFLEKVLELLEKQTLKPFEIIISDQTPVNDRPKGFYERFFDLPLKVINLDKPAHASAQNIGSKASTGDILIFLDDDCEFSEDFVENHMNVLSEENVDAVVGPNSADTQPSEESENINLKRRDLLSIYIKKVPYNWNGMVMYTIGGNTSIRRESFFKVGGYDEKIPRMADVELGIKLYRNGAKIYHSAKPFVHHLKAVTGGTRKSQKDIPYLRSVSYLYLYKKYFPGWSTSQFYLREVINALLFREPINGKTRFSNFKNPLFPFFRIFKLARAVVDSGKLLS